MEIGIGHGHVAPMETALSRGEAGRDRSAHGRVGFYEPHMLAADVDC
jgi:hypothetical protein